MRGLPNLCFPELVWVDSSPSQASSDDGTHLPNLFATFDPNGEALAGLAGLTEPSPAFFWLEPGECL